MKNLLRTQFAQKLTPGQKLRIFLILGLILLVEVPWESIFPYGSTDSPRTD